MGLRALPGIVRRLLKSGASGSRPAAVVSNASTERQRVVTAPLSRISAQAARFGIESPALTIVGPVVNLRPPPLMDKDVLVLRPEHQSGKLSDLLRRKHARVTECPAIEIASIRPNPALDRALAGLDRFDWIFLTSANSVRILKPILTVAYRKLRHPPRIAAIGPGTRESLRDLYVKAHLVPHRDFSSEGLAEEFLRGNKKRQTIFLPQAGAAREVLAQTLNDAGHRVTAVPLYETRPLAGSSSKIRRWIRKTETGLIPLTSASIAAVFARAAARSDMRHLRIVSIGPVTTDAARRAGLAIAAESPQAALADLIETLETVA